MNLICLITFQLTFTCSKSTKETLEKGVKYVQTHNTPERRHWRRSDVFIKFS